MALAAYVAADRAVAEIVVAASSVVLWRIHVPIRALMSPPSIWSTPWQHYERPKYETPQHGNLAGRRSGSCIEFRCTKSVSLLHVSTIVLKRTHRGLVMRDLGHSLGRSRLQGRDQASMLGYGQLSKLGSVLGSFL